MNKIVIVIKDIRYKYITLHLNFIFGQNNNPNKL